MITVNNYAVRSPQIGFGRLPKVLGQYHRLLSEGISSQEQEQLLTSSELSKANALYLEKLNKYVANKPQTGVKGSTEKRPEFNGKGLQPIRVPSKAKPSIAFLRVKMRAKNAIAMGVLKIKELNK